MVLVDTSVWVEVFRKGTDFSLEDHVAFDEIVTCPMIQEVLQGFREERAFRTVREAMFALPIVESPLAAERSEKAVALYLQVSRRDGYDPPPHRTVAVFLERLFNNFERARFRARLFVRPLHRI